MSSKRSSHDSPLRSALKSPDKSAKRLHVKPAEYDIGSPAIDAVTVHTNPDEPREDCNLQELRT